jgi:hypothetical protein
MLKKMVSKCDEATEKSVNHYASQLKILSINTKLLQVEVLYEQAVVVTHCDE